jgi:hypothetical protein
MFYRTCGEEIRSDAGAVRPRDVESQISFQVVRRPPTGERRFSPGLDDEAENRTRESNMPIPTANDAVGGPSKLDGEIVRPGI